jgi:hypothetical protein
VSEDILCRWRLVMEEGRKVGHTYSQPDLMIAATALHHGLTVVTRNRDDFDKAGVTVINPGKSRRTASWTPAADALPPAQLRLRSFAREVLQLCRSALIS